MFMASASRIISDVCMNMNDIVFPSTKEELRQMKDGFYSIVNFPNVVGAIDGTITLMQVMMNPVLYAGRVSMPYICRL